MASITSTPATSTSRSSRTTRRSAAGVSPSGVSPTRISRLQEKEELRQLNDRLANYIERVRQLENDKLSMQVLLEEKEESVARETGNIRRLYEAELTDARKTLDNTANERARLQIEFSQLSEDHRKLLARNNKNESELNTAVDQWRTLEAALNSKEAECANLLSGNRRLETEISDVKTQLVNVELALKNAKSQLNSEMLRRVDAENQIQTLQEQLDFQKHVSDQEMREMRSRHETRLVEVDSGRQREFESKLAEAMQQLRQEHETQIQQYKEQLEHTFVAKLENAQQSAVKNSDYATSIKEELAGTKLRVESQSSQISQLQKQNMVLEGRVRDLEETLDRERGLAQQRLSLKEQEMADLRQRMQAQLEEYQSLLDVKLTLDMEINAYRKMLEGEEQRLNLSPSPSQHGAVPRTHMQGARKLRGKKRKHEGGSGLSPSYKVSQHSSARGNVSIEEIDLEGNYIRLKNFSDMDQPLGGWTVRKTHASAPDILFQIPPPCLLRAGQTLTVWALGAGVEPNPPSDLVLKSHRTWGVVSDVRVFLINPNNEETAERRLVCVQRKAEGDSDVEFDEECVTGSEFHLRRQPKRRKKKCCSLS
ncbi:lamin L3 isoform X2 [Chanos chanos]|uniref:Lamin-L(III)-like isoform X2 n=1 Tax=Chanos chanos TaxID=29144 RepID=A0A6J2UNX0_CHACN|nr:lamin-L(III)-like isoform X2 [Chanos chanos]XP_030622130.1 lamin-L(III)-like isoform X2 [Chanos chanos]